MCMHALLLYQPSHALAYCSSPLHTHTTKHRRRKALGSLKGGDTLPLVREGPSKAQAAAPRAQEPLPWQRYVVLSLLLLV